MIGNSAGRVLFEVAQVYRSVYALRTAYDRQPVMTVPAAIDYGELLLRRDPLKMPADHAASARVRPAKWTRRPRTP